MEQKVNYQKNLDKLLQEIKESHKTPSLLLHSCCGPCSSYCLDYLKDYFRITVFYYNPNIYPEEEYELRLSEQKRLLEEAYCLADFSEADETYCLTEPSETDETYCLTDDSSQTENAVSKDLADLTENQYEIRLLTLPYDHQEFLEAAKGFEAEPEGGLRCEQCFKLRLDKTAEVAKEKGFDYFGTTLTVSPHKNAMLINKVGHEAEALFATDPQENAMLINNKETGTLFANDLLAEPTCTVDNGRAFGDEPACFSFPLWLESDFKKKNGYLRSIELSEQYHLYRQNYCGCEFALNASPRA